MVRQWILLLCLLLPLTVVARDVVSEETVGATKKDRPIPKHQWNYLTKLWLGRSCVGEAGFDAVDECVGIAWTMATRAREYHTTFLRIVQSYSAAIKPHERHRRPWIFELHYDGEKPRSWPAKLNWRLHKRLWLRILDTLDRWAKGKIPNPVEGANHFGGDMDEPRETWITIEPNSDVEFRNTFYRQKMRGESS